MLRQIIVHVVVGLRVLVAEFFTAACWLTPLVFLDLLFEELSLHVRSIVRVLRILLILQKDSVAVEEFLGAAIEVSRPAHPKVRFVFAGRDSSVTYWYGMLSRVSLF